jgi:hypothetical protein
MLNFYLLFILSFSLLCAHVSHYFMTTIHILTTRKCLIYSYSVFRHKQISLGHIFFFCLSSQTDSFRIQTLCRHFMTTTILNMYRSHIDYPHCRIANNVGFTNDQKQMVRFRFSQINPLTDRSVGWIN